MKCCVPMCRNWSDKRGETAEKISFHVFPSDDYSKHRWIKAINREAGWEPTKYTKICSLHFEDQYFYFSKKGLKKIRGGAYPTLKIETCREESDGQKEIKQENVNDYLTLNDTPREKVLKHEIFTLKKREKKLTLKVRRLQMTSLRLKRKVSDMASVIKALKNKLNAKKERRANKRRTTSTSSTE